MINFWDWLRTSFIFIPLLEVLGSIILGISLPALEQVYGVYSILGEMTPESVQNLLAAIATAMMTVASLVFSIAIVSLTVAASELGPHLLRTFTSNKSTQIALGLFIGTGIYAILVLMVVREKGEMEFVPNVSVFLAAVFTIVSLSYLVYFTHRVSQLIQAPNVAQVVSCDLDKAINRLYPERFGVHGRDMSPEDVEEKLRSFGENYRVIPSEHEGYLEGVDGEGLMEFAVKHDLILKLYYRPGEFVLAASPLVKVWPFERPGVNLVKHLNNAFIVGNRPTPRQDVECSINELVEVALRALSPSLNDPFTAINCIDRLAACLSRLAEREIPSPYRLDNDGNLRVVAQPVRFSGALNAAFDQIRQNAAHHVSVHVRMLEALGIVARFTHRQEDRAAIQRQADMIKQFAERRIEEPYDLKDVQQRFAQVQENLRLAAHPNSPKA